MAEYICREDAVSEGYLSDWYISSVGSESPVWTDEHISELLNDFIVLPKDTKAADVQLVKHGKWIDCTFYDPCERNYEQDFEFKCSNCGHKIYNKPNDNNLFCGHCSARMDG